MAPKIAVNKNQLNKAALSGLHKVMLSGFGLSAFEAPNIELPHLMQTIAVYRLSAPHFLQFTLTSFFY